MHRTQIYFDEPLFEHLKQKANKLGVSISEYIKALVKQDLEKEMPKKQDFSKFAGMWEGRDISLKSLREKAWK